MAGFSMHLLGYIFNRIFTEINNRGARYFVVIWTQTFGTFSHPLNITWLSLTCTDSEERALAMAMVIMGANIAGIYGAQIFRQDDRPRYRRAFSIACAVLAFGLILAIVRWGYDILTRRRNGGRRRSVGNVGSDSEQDFEKEAAAPPADGQPLPVVVGDGKRLSVSGGLRGTS